VSRCICEYPPTCSGDGALYCQGCGGDLCVCRACGGSGMSIGIECQGCDDCIDRSEDEPPEDEAAEARFASHDEELAFDEGDRDSKPENEESE